MRWTSIGESTEASAIENATGIAVIDGLLLLRLLAGPDAANRAAATLLARP